MIAILLMSLFLHVGYGVQINAMHSNSSLSNAELELIVEMTQEEVDALLEEAFSSTGQEVGRKLVDFRDDCDFSSVFNNTQILSYGSLISEVDHTHNSMFFGQKLELPLEDLMFWGQPLLDCSGDLNPLGAAALESFSQAGASIIPVTCEQQSSTISLKHSDFEEVFNNTDDEDDFDYEQYIFNEKNYRDFDIIFDTDLKPFFNARAIKLFFMIALSRLTSPDSPFGKKSEEKLYEQTPFFTKKENQFVCEHLNEILAIDDENLQKAFVFLLVKNIAFRDSVLSSIERQALYSAVMSVFHKTRGLAQQNVYRAAGKIAQQLCCVTFPAKDFLQAGVAPVTSGFNLFKIGFERLIQGLRDRRTVRNTQDCIYIFIEFFRSTYRYLTKEPALRALIIKSIDAALSCINTMDEYAELVQEMRIFIE